MTGIFVRQVQRISYPQEKIKKVCSVTILPESHFSQFGELAGLFFSYILKKKQVQLKQRGTAPHSLAVQTKKSFLEKQSNYIYMCRHLDISVTLNLPDTVQH